MHPHGALNAQWVGSIRRLCLGGTWFCRSEVFSRRATWKRCSIRPSHAIYHFSSFFLWRISYTSRCSCSMVQRNYTYTHNVIYYNTITIYVYINTSFSKWSKSIMLGGDFIMLQNARSPKIQSPFSGGQR